MKDRLYVIIDKAQTGKQIRYYMNMKHFSISDLQDICGFQDPKPVKRWLKGDTLPSYVHLCTLAHAFEIEVGALLYSRPVSMEEYYNQH